LFQGEYGPKREGKKKKLGGGKGPFPKKKKKKKKKPKSFGKLSGPKKKGGQTFFRFFLFSISLDFFFKFFFLFFQKKKKGVFWANKGGIYFWVKKFFFFSFLNRPQKGPQKGKILKPPGFFFLGKKKTMGIFFGGPGFPEPERKGELGGEERGENPTPLFYPFFFKGAWGEGDWGKKGAGGGGPRLKENFGVNLVFFPGKTF